MRFIADLHIHSKYSRATSKDMNLPTLSYYAQLKGIDVLGTGDFTHPVWLTELKSHLTPVDYGLFKFENTYFILSAEVSNIFTYKGKIRKVHNIIFAPDFVIVERISKQLSRYGELMQDGRPTLNLTCEALVKLVMDISADCMVVPAHAWTPWFSLFGANSGFDSIYECYGEMAKCIFAIETGLSSDPPMNWRLSNLDKITLISNSDAHSPAKIGREANVFDTSINYHKIMHAIKTREGLLYTIEFFPEEGKYHYDGHRRCNLRLSPTETKQYSYLCPNCKRPLTVGVLHRVEQLADRENGIKPKDAANFKYLVPLQEIISKARGKSQESVEEEYMTYLKQVGTEFSILLDYDERQLFSTLPECIALGILNVRNGLVERIPGYDGVFGEIKIILERKPTVAVQLSLFEHTFD